MVLLVGGMSVVAAGCDLTISGNQTMGDYTIAFADKVIFDPNVSTTLTMTGNLIVDGTLEIRPANAGVVHKIVFATADESAFQGASMADMPPFNAVTSDVGLWVLHSGRLNISGTPREPWANATGALAANATTITLNRDLTGWRVGDELSVTPTAANDYTNFERPNNVPHGNDGRQCLPDTTAERNGLPAAFRRNHDAHQPDCADHADLLLTCASEPPSARAAEGRTLCD